LTPEEDAEEDEGRRVSLEALEEDALLTPCAFQIAQIMRSSNRRPQASDSEEEDRFAGMFIRISGRMKDVQDGARPS